MIRAIIIDDEEESRNTIFNILSDFCKDIIVIAQADNVQNGILKIQKQKPDVIFLDIHMPDGTGFDLLEKITAIDFQIIFITAYDQYALKAIKFSALDYILKPVDPQQLIEAVKKIKKSETDFGRISNQINTLLENRNGFHRISLPTLKGLRFINLKDIIRCEADNNYTNFFLNSGEKILVTKTLKEYDESLSSLYFVRVHQSHLINTRFVEQYLKGEGGTIVMADGSEVEVSRRRKDEFLNRMVEN